MGFLGTILGGLIASVVAAWLIGVGFALSTLGSGHRGQRPTEGMYALSGLASGSVAILYGVLARQYALAQLRTEWIALPMGVVLAALPFVWIGLVMSRYKNEGGDPAEDRATTSFLRFGATMTTLAFIVAVWSPDFVSGLPLVSSLNRGRLGEGGR